MSAIVETGQKCSRGCRLIKIDEETQWRQRWLELHLFLAFCPHQGCYYFLRAFLAPIYVTVVFG